MEVRTAVKKDWDQLKGLLLQMGKVEDESSLKKRLMEIIEDDASYLPVVVVNHEIVGYAWAQDYGCHLRSGEKTSRLHDLFVHQDFRHKGAATELFNSVKNWAEQNNTRWLQWSAHSAAAGFYTQMGMEPVEEDGSWSFEIEFGLKKM